MPRKNYLDFIETGALVAEFHVLVKVYGQIDDLSRGVFVVTRDGGLMSGLITRGVFDNLITFRSRAIHQTRRIYENDVSIYTGTYYFDRMEDLMIFTLCMTIFSENIDVDARLKRIADLSFGEEWEL